MSKSAYKHEPHISKKKQLTELIDLLSQYKNIGITKVENITSKTIQRLRTDMRQDAILKLAKNTLMLLAIKEIAKKDKGIKKT
jgi:large subunit ribosomal protein L10